MKKSILMFSLLLLVFFFPINTFGECIKGDCENGQGTYKFPAGGKYIGEWKNGKRHGQGTSTYFDGSKYVGEYKNDERDGTGTHISPDGKKYVGKWKAGEYMGK